MRSPRFFTLIELLVIIAVIALLIALLLPGLGRARATAYRTACGNNLRQIGTSVNLYFSDYSGRFPFFGLYFQKVGGANVMKSTNRWYVTMLPYLAPNQKTVNTSKGLPIYRCPSESKLTDPERVYTYNGTVGGVVGSDWTASGSNNDGDTLRVIRIKKPTRTMTFCDGGPTIGGYIDFRNETDITGGVMRVGYHRHWARANIVYADAHVETHSCGRPGYGLTKEQIASRDFHWAGAPLWE